MRESALPLTSRAVGEPSARVVVDQIALRVCVGRDDQFAELTDEDPHERIKQAADLVKQRSPPIGWLRRAVAKRR
jgi:hypothetical protein